MKLKKVDSVIASLVILLTLFGLLIIADTSLIEGQTGFGDQFFFLKRQLGWAGIGLFLGVLTSQINYQYWRKLAGPGLVFGSLLLLAVFLPGLGSRAYGSSRWLNLGFAGGQPVEFLKLAVIIYSAKLFSTWQEEGIGLKLIPLLAPIALLLLEPDFSSTVLVVATIISILFLSGYPLGRIVPAIAVCLVLGLVLIASSAYRRQRVAGLLDPFSDPQNKTYHAYQTALTLGSGGWLGLGLGQSRQKYHYLPEVTSDSIIAVVAEEFGFLGVTTLIIAFGVLIFRGLKTAFGAPDNFGKLLASGVISLILFQGLINLGAVAIILPLTGMPFPFVSHGGSSLVALSAGIGIVLNIAGQKKVKT
ncbi:MAG: putative peptidoglycan glycosyltransferase FtsW [Patescibacteria group bacterium]